VERIERYRISSVPFLASEQSAFISGNDTICDNDYYGAAVMVDFSGSAPFTFIYSVNGVNQPSITTTVNPYVINTFDAGTYTLQSYNDAISVGTTSGSALVTILESPTALFTTVPDTLSILYPSIQLNDVSIGNITDWQWYFGDGNISYQQNPYHTYQDLLGAGAYQISLTVMDDKGCSDTTFKQIWISDETWMYIPNAFTPNGDGQNDKFCIEYHGIRENTFTFNVYNRSSDLVYSTDSIHNLDCVHSSSGSNNGWDGKHQITGNNLSNGVYTYEVYYQDFEGWKHQVNGKVSIIRDISNLSNDFECYPQGISNCRFGDMIDPQYGFIYPTSEDINNW
jgi:gliding motility-associated-like protein